MKVTAVVGSYRTGQSIDTLVTKVLEGAESNQAEINKIFLIESDIHFCKNCRSCTESDVTGQRAECVIQDDMGQILNEIDESDVLILSSPMNFGSITAVTKKFIERLAVYYKWEQDKIAAPSKRIKEGKKKGLIVMSSTMPAFIGKIVSPGMKNIMKDALSAMGAGDIRVLYAGMITGKAPVKLSEKLLEKAYRTGKKITSN